MNSVLAIAHTEWLKIKAFKPFWVVFWLYPVCLSGVAAIALWGQNKIQGLAQSSGTSEAVAANLPLAFPLAWQTVAYIASWLHFIPALLLILNVTNEFTFRSHRQNLLEGWSRAQFLSAKLLLALAISLFCTLNVALLSVGAGAASGTAPTLSGFAYIPLFLLQSIIYSVFALLLAFLIRRAALALAAFLMYSMILETVLSFLINWRFNGFGGYLPLKAAGSLLPAPLFKEHAPQAAKNLLAEPSPSALMITAAVYLLLFVGAMAQRFRREDL
jgi:hypothetical protein